MGSVWGVGVSGAFQRAALSIEGNQIVGQEGFEPANPSFNATAAAFDFAIQPHHIAPRTPRTAMKGTISVQSMARL